MRWTGLNTMQIQNEFDKLPHYKWVERTVVNNDGSKQSYTVRVQID
jgi:hypothetical protein